MWIRLGCIVPTDKDMTKQVDDKKRQSESSDDINYLRKPDISTEFDTWSIFKRTVKVDPYVLTAKYRASKGPAKRAKSAVVKRNRRRPDSRADSEGGWDSSRSQTTATDFYDLDKEFPDDFDYDAEPEDFIFKKEKQKTTPAQQQYNKACKRLDILPASYFFRHLEDDKIVMKYRVLGPDGAKACAIALLSNSTVTSIDLTGNDIGPVGTSYIADLLRENHFISNLNLRENRLGVEGAKLIIKVVTEVDGLTGLNLAGNGFREHDIEIFINLFEETRNLKYLSLSHNEFREFGNHRQAFGDAIEWNDNLEELDLSWNHIRRKGAVTIAESLEMNTCLKKLDVSWNGFYLDGSKAISKALEVNKTLLELDLSSNRIDKECLEKLMAGLKKNKTLVILRLAWNPITSAGALSLLNMLDETKTTALKEVDLHTQDVELPFIKLAEKLWNERKIKVIHGPVYGLELETLDQDEQVLVDANPVIVLIEFGKLMGFRLMDLFAAFDKDGSKSLDKAEIRNGLKFANIPLTDKNLEKLIEKLDVDNDGEIDYSELLAAKAIHRKQVGKMMKAMEMDEDMEQTEIGRIRSTLQRLMAKMMKGNPAFKSGVTSFSKIISAGNLLRIKDEVVYNNSGQSFVKNKFDEKGGDKSGKENHIVGATKKKLNFLSQNNQQDTNEWRVLH